MNPLCGLQRAKGFLLLPLQPFPLFFSAGLEQKLNLTMGCEEKDFIDKPLFLGWGLDF